MRLTAQLEARFFPALLVSLLASTRLGAQTVTVDTGADAIDVDWQTATVDDLPGPDGRVSFGEAMIACNNTAGPQTIGFAIPQEEWGLQFLFPGRAVIQMSGGGFFARAFDEVTIDGTTQTAFTGDTNPDGAEVALFGAELFLVADHCTLVGFDGTAVNLDGSFGTIRDCTGTMGISLYGGGQSLIAGNRGGTIKIDRSNDNVVVGNVVQRVRVLGWFGGGLPATGNRIGGPDPADRNWITGYGTWDGEGFPGGTTVQLFDSIGTVVENNWIGTTPDGLAQGNLASTVGVGLEGENHDVVVRGNRIAGILGHGIGPHAQGFLFGTGVFLGGRVEGFELVGNVIGRDATGAPVLGAVTGIDVSRYNPLGISGVRIGGTGAGDGNDVAGHLLAGVVVQGTTQDVRVLGNSISENGALGIDLVGPDFVTGVTANDPLDADAGANGLQNFPVLTSATAGPGSLRVRGMLRSLPLAEFTVELFASPSCDPSGFGEAAVLLGRTSVTTDAAGDAGLDVEVAAAPPGWSVTATATLDPLGGTSELSACVPVTAGGSGSSDAAGRRGRRP